jgi:hypothetical protein
MKSFAAGADSVLTVVVDDFSLHFTAVSGGRKAKIG